MCHGPRQPRHQRRNPGCSLSEPPESGALLLRLCNTLIQCNTASATSGAGQGGGATAQTASSCQQPAGATAAQLSLDSVLLLTLHNLLHCPGNHKETSCAQQNAPELVPELGWEAIQGQGLVGEQEVAGNNQVGEEDGDEGDGYERGVASRPQAVRPGINLEAHDLPLQDIVCNGPGKTDHWILQPQTKMHDSTPTP